MKWASGEYPSKLTCEDKLRGVFFMKNDYEIRGDVTVIFLKHKGRIIETIIDTADLPKADSFINKWMAREDVRSQSIYVDGNLYKINGIQKRTSLHRWLMDAPIGFVVDHINHKTLDNRRSVNLRTCTHAENCQNFDKARRNNKSSGVLGVHYFKQAKKWRAQVRVKGFSYAEYFDSLEEAERAVKEIRAKQLPFSQESLKSVAITN
jgi:hypothetical protein